MRDLKPHQVEGVAKLTVSPRMVLADDMGLGKTIQSIRAAINLHNAVPGVRLVVFPASARNVWPRELVKEGIAEGDIFQAKTGKAIHSYRNQPWFLISLPLFRQHFEAVARLVWPVGIFILDEAHNIKDIKSKGNMSVTPMALRCPVFWALTGTPMKNDYSEMFSLARLVVPHSVMMRNGVADFYKWRDTFCVLETELVWTMVFDKALRRKVRKQITVQKIAGSQNAQLLKSIIGPYIVRRLKKAVLKGLPDLTWQELYVEGIRADFDDDTLSEMREAAEKGRAPKGQHIATARVAWAMQAVPSAVEIVEEHVESDPNPMIVFCNYLEPIAALEAALRDKGLRVGVITGSVPEKDRVRIVDDFQNGRLDVFIGQTLAAGTAITLTRANRVLFIDLAWSPADNAQARDRAHRIGQDKEVLAQYLVSDDPLSERVISILAQKTQAIEQLETAS